MSQPKHNEVVVCKCELAALREAAQAFYSLASDKEEYSNLFDRLDAWGFISREG